MTNNCSERIWYLSRKFTYKNFIIRGFTFAHAIALHPSELFFLAGLSAFLKPAGAAKAAAELPSFLYALVTLHCNR